MNVSQAIPDNIEHFQQAEPKHYFDYKNWRLKILHLATIFPQLVAKRRPNDFFNFEPCFGINNLNNPLTYTGFIASSHTERRTLHYCIIN